MAILERFTDIIKANINELLDKCEDPAKMIDQYLRNMTEDLRPPPSWRRRPVPSGCWMTTMPRSSGTRTWPARR